MNTAAVLVTVQETVTPSLVTVFLGESQDFVSVRMSQQYHSTVPLNPES